MKKNGTQLAFAFFPIYILGNMENDEMPFIARPEDRLADSYLDFCMETWGHVHDNYILHDPTKYRSWKNRLLQEYSDAERGIGLRPGFVPSITFWIMLGERVIGVSNIRTRLNSALLLYGGHLGLCIRPSERRKGHARAVMPGLFGTAHSLGIGMLMTSTTADNAASIHLCESMPFFRKETGTVLLDGAPRRILRYWHGLD